MASKTAVVGVLAFLHELYPNRDVGAATAEAWALTFSDWSDDDLKACAKRAATTPGRTFFPTPGEIAAFRAPVAVVDSAKLIRQIERIGRNIPGAGYIAPQVSDVRETMGDVVADAYAAAGGGARVFSSDETTRAIAYREFHKLATEYAAMPDMRPILLDGPPPARRIAGPRNAPAESVAAIVSRALSAGKVPA